MSNPSTTDSQLCDMLCRQIDTYTAALPLAQELAESYDLTDASQLKLQQLHQLVGQAAALDVSILEQKSRLAERQIELGSETRLASQRLAGLIEQMIQSFNRIERKASAAKEQLAPHFDQHVQATKMRAAYQPHTGNSK